jgi:hypothetical protein
MKEVRSLLPFGMGPLISGFKHELTEGLDNLKLLFVYQNHWQK